MKNLFAALVAVFTLALAQASYAQTAISQSGSQAQSQSQSQSGSLASSNNSIVFPSAPSRTRTDINNVPSVTAPSVFGGGHPCLAGASGGLSIMGGGLSAGGSDLEVVCMLYVMGQHEAAIRALASKNGRACQALENVGYYIVPMGNGKTKAVQFRCKDKTVKGGVYTSSAAAVLPGNAVAAAPRPKARPSLGYTKCAKREDGKVAIRYESGADKNAARQACLASLGY